jgi:heme exporter protein D
MGNIFLIGVACGITLMLLIKYILVGIKEIEAIIREILDKH